MEGLLELGQLVDPDSVCSQGRAPCEIPSVPKIWLCLKQRNMHWTYGAGLSWACRPSWAVTPGGRPGAVNLTPVLLEALVSWLGPRPALPSPPPTHTHYAV